MTRPFFMTDPGRGRRYRTDRHRHRVHQRRKNFDKNVIRRIGALVPPVPQEQGDGMDIEAIQFSETFLDAVADLAEDARERLLGSLELEVFETTVDPATVFADNPRVVGWVVLDGEDGASTFLALKADSNEVQSA